MVNKDYYTRLGLSRNATPDEIRAAYRKRARQYHPDVNKDSEAQEIFKEINEAYEVLKDPQKRARYDSFGAEWQHSPETSSGSRADNTHGGGVFSRRFTFNSRGEFGEHDSFDDFIHRMFNDAGNTMRMGGSCPQPEPDEAELTVSLSDLFSQAQKAISLQTLEQGHHGTLRPTIRNLKVNLPRGITDGSQIRLAGQGGMDQASGRRRDLILRVRISHDPFFTLDGHDLYTTVALAPWEAVLGTKIPVQTLESTVNLTIPAGSQTGRRFRLRDKGLPDASGGAGDLIVEIEIHIPRELSAEEERLFRDLAKTSTYNPRKYTRQRSTNTKQQRTGS